VQLHSSLACGPPLNSSDKLLTENIQLFEFLKVVAHLSRINICHWLCRAHMYCPQNANSFIFGSCRMSPGRTSDLCRFPCSCYRNERKKLVNVIV